MVTRVPCRQEHGRDEKRREWGWKEEEKKKGELRQGSPSGIRTSLDCSAAACAQPDTEPSSLGSHKLLTGSCRDAPTGVHLLSCGCGWSWKFRDFESCDTGLRWHRGEFCCGSGRFTESQGFWICHRWKGGEQQPVAGCTEQRSPGKKRQSRGERVLWWVLAMKVHSGACWGCTAVHSLQACAISYSINTELLFRFMLVCFNSSPPDTV